MNQITSLVLKALHKAGLVEVETSARHVHLCQHDMEVLFGSGAQLTPKRPLSQPGQFLSEQRVTLIGPKGKKEHVAVLGPERAKTQVELSRSDCLELGVEAPIRESGDLAASGIISIQGPMSTLTLEQGVIIALSHIHVTPEIAALLELNDQQHVGVKLMTDRPLILRDVIIRVSENCRYRMHIDVDEANAANVSGFTLGQIMK